MSQPRGGDISMVVTHSPRASLAPKGERSARGVSGSASGAAAAVGAAMAFVAILPRGLTERARSAMCSGVVPQQPPTPRAPRFT